MSVALSLTSLNSLISLNSLLTALISIIQYYQRCQYAWHPAEEREQKDDNKRATALVDNRQGWKQNRKNNSEK